MSIRAESDISHLLERLETHPHRGLSQVEAYNRLRRFGTNEIERPYLLFWRVGLAALFCLAMGIVLVAEGAPWYALGTAATGIALMVLSWALRSRYRQAVIASGDRVPGICLGIRGGRLLRLPVYQLVPGDIVRIETGEIVPADGRLTEAVNLVVQEEVLSGSPEPIAKDALQPNDPSVRPEESRNRVFMNTVVIRGRGTFVVTETGKNTRIGRIRAPARGKRAGES